MKTLKLFNAVVSKPGKNDVVVSNDGYVISPGAAWAQKNILDYYNKERLNGNDLNKTFHKSWTKIKNSSRFELYLEQVRHYISTYGSDFQDKIYIPAEELNIPTDLRYKVINAYSEEEMRNKCLDMLKSGAALKEETVDDLLSILVDELNYTFTGQEGIKNKEAIVKIADQYGVLPHDTMEFFRYVVYRATGSTTLIKNREAINAIKAGSFNPSVQFNQFGLTRLAQIFNRFKPLFLAFKKKCPRTINKISKLSKVYHKPLVENPLNKVTSYKLQNSDDHWLKNATPFALFKALDACNARIKGQDSFIYRVRNGKSFIKENSQSNTEVLAHNYIKIIEEIRNRLDLTGINVYIPDNIQYALPTSEKMFVGNIPAGTKIFGEKLAVGIYWEDSWGARDLDLSAIMIGGQKIGWNAGYRSAGRRGGLMFSGDITSAPNGAVEYLYADEGLDTPALIQNNVFSGRDDCEYKIIVGAGDDISRDYMMNPNNLLFETKCQSVQKQTILGMMVPANKGQCFILMNTGSGNKHVSGAGKLTEIAQKAMMQQWCNCITFNELVVELGGNIVSERSEADIDFSLDSLEKDSFTKMFN